MAQGTRGRVWRVAVAGVGALLCGSLAGCLNADKHKDKAQTKPGIGLPGTPMLQPGGSATKAPSGTGAPGAFTGAGANLQPQPRVGSTGQNTNTGTGGTGIQPVGGIGSAGPQPGFGAGAISPPTPPSGSLPGGTVPPPNMTAPQWGTNYPPVGSGPANPVQPPMNDIAPPPPLGAPGASVLPPQPSAAAPSGFGVLPPSGP